MLVRNNFLTEPVQPKYSLASNNLNSANIDNETLVKLVKSKSEKGFNILYDKYCVTLYSVIMKFVNNTKIADDLLQDVFLKIWLHIEDFDSKKGTLFTWMLKIARNQAIDFLRSSQHRNQLRNVTIDMSSHNTDYFDSNDSNGCLVEFKDIRSKVLKLDPKYADVIDLIFFYGYTHEQTAEIMNLPLGTVKTRSRKGLNILKKLYQPEYLAAY